MRHEPSAVPAVAVYALGQLLAAITITATLAGYRELLAWIAGSRARLRVEIEGASSYTRRRQVATL